MVHSGRWFPRLACRAQYASQRPRQFESIRLHAGVPYFQRLLEGNATFIRWLTWARGYLVMGVFSQLDHRDNGSIQGAMVSGRRVAEALLQDLA